MDGRGANQRGACGVGHGVQRQYYSDGLFDIRTELKQDHPGPATLFAQCFDVAPGNGVQGRFHNRAQGRNTQGNHGGGDEEEHGDQWACAGH